MTILPKVTYRFSTIPVKIAMAFFTEIEQNNFKMCLCELKSPVTSKYLQPHGL